MLQVCVSGVDLFLVLKEFLLGLAHKRSKVFKWKPWSYKVQIF